MGFLIALMTLVMVLDCIILIFLVLIQLPKKEAGAGLAFGASATDALFGAGSGNVLTKITKYAATIFFVMAIVLSMMFNFYHNRSSSTFEKTLGQTLPVGPITAPAGPGILTSAPPGTSGMVLPKSAAESPNIPALTNPPSTTNVPQK